MARALVGMLDESRPGRIIPGFSGTMIRYFVGDDLADMLEVPRPNRARSFVRRASLAAVAAGFAEQHSRAVRRIAGVLSRGLLRTYTTFDRGGDRPSFEIPTHLAATWNIRPRSARR